MNKHLPGLGLPVGATPMVNLDRLHSRTDVALWGKLEGNNPGSSVKDRPALNMILRAQQRGELEGKRLIEATSGNTGIALAMAAAVLDLPITLVMPDNATRERILTMKAFGAEVHLVPAQASMEGAIDFVRNRVSEGGWHMLDQFSNPDNWGAHYASTGPEIWSDTTGRVTHFVSSMGTTGTIMGVSRALKERNASIEIIGVQPTAGSSIPGIRRWPKEYLPKIFEPQRVDRIIDVSTSQAETMARQLARSCGVFVGTSSGGAVHAALQAIADLPPFSATAIAPNESNATYCVVCILCDRGDRYLSSDLFA